VLMVVEKNKAEEVLHAISQLPEGEGSAIIGEITKEHAGKVRLRTQWAERFVPMLPGEQLPRIC